MRARDVLPAVFGYGVGLAIRCLLGVAFWLFLYALHRTIRGSRE